MTGCFSDSVACDMVKYPCLQHHQSSASRNKNAARTGGITFSMYEENRAA
jgi:hypothetical protein